MQSLDDSLNHSEKWKREQLGNIADFVNGYGFGSTQWGKHGLPIIRIQNLTNTSDEVNYYDGDLDTRFLVKNGDLLVSWSASLDAFVWRGGEAWVNQHIFKISDVRADVDRQFLYYALRHVISEIRVKTRGSTMKHVTRKEFLATQIPFPPLAEQRAIAHVLRTVQEAKESTERVIAATRELKKSLMHHLFTYGPVPLDQVDQVPLKETEIGQVPEHWETCRLEQLLREPLKNGHSARETNDPAGVPTLTLSAVTLNDFSPRNIKITAAEPSKVRDLWLEAGDILIERANTKELVGVAAIYEGVSDYAIYPDLVIRIRPDEARLLPRFLADYLMTPPARNYFTQNARGTAGNMPKINQQVIQAAEVPVPRIDDQQAVATHLRTVDHKLDAEQQRLEALEGLFSSLLHYLMTGKLRVADVAEQVDELIG